MYAAEINRRQPACLLLLIDQSGSMADRWGNTGSKADQLALAVNRLLGNAVLLCSKGDDRVHNYFEVGILGYGSSSGEVVPALHGSSANRPLLPISEIAYNPKRVDQVTRKEPDGAGGLVQTQIPVPIWVDPVSYGGTPMVRALTQAEGIVSQWCDNHSASFPPIVINVTDGQSTDGDPKVAGERIRATSTADGPSLLFNVHLSALRKEPSVFPGSAAGLPDAYASSLFEMSSVLPPSMRQAAASLGHHVDQGSRGFLYNADATTMIEFLDIGTRAVTPTGLKELTAGPSSMR